MRLLSLLLNRRPRTDAIADNLLLLDYLRETAGLTGTKRGCDGGECGACTVLVDGEPRLACLTIASRCEGASVETIEALAAGGRMSALQAAFHGRLGTQCCFCTPGMVMAAVAFAKTNPAPSEDEVRHGLEGNICRCTGYQGIVDAIMTGARAMHAGKA